MSITDQVMLAAWEHETRNLRGEWTHGASLNVAHGQERHGYEGKFEGYDPLNPPMTPADGRKPLELPGRPDGAGTPDDPIDPQGDMSRAVDLMIAGKHVRLDGPHELPALADAINRRGDAVGAGVGSNPPWDLGNVSVRGTRLFNEQTTGIARANMPQLAGPAQPGSEAALLAGGANHFFIADPQFRRQLERDGVDVKDERVNADQLRATQTQLTATTVSGIARADVQGNAKVAHMLREPIWVTKDNYVIDGHHRWAAGEMIAAMRGNFAGRQIEVHRINLPVALAIPYANQFAQRIGIATKTLGGTGKLVGAANITMQAIDLAGWSTAWMHEERGWHGRWGHGTGPAQPPELLKKLGHPRTLPSGLTSKDYKNAIDAVTARNLKRGQWIAYASTALDPSGFGFTTVFRPVRITSVRHKTVGRGKKRHPWVTYRWEEQDGSPGGEETLRAGAQVDTMNIAKLEGKVTPPKPRPAPKPKGHPHDPFGPNWRPPPPPPPAPPVPAPHPYGKAHFGTVTDDYPTGGTEQAVAEVQHGLDLQGRDVPGLADHQDITITENLPEQDEGDQSVLGETMHPTPGHPVSDIYVKPEVTKAYAGPGAEDMLKSNEADGWWVPVDPGYTLADLIVAHEMGHAVANRVRASALESPELWDGLAKQLGLDPPDYFNDPLTHRSLPDPGAWVDSNKMGISWAVSTYASHNQFELEAELWCEYTLSSHPRPAAKFYGDYVMARLPKSVVAAK